MKVVNASYGSLVNFVPSRIVTPDLQQGTFGVSGPFFRRDMLVAAFEDGNHRPKARNSCVNGVHRSFLR
jgi:hypothetical protein